MPLPKPEPGLVISYSYLWHRERQMERPEGAKARPCVIVLSAPREGLTIVTVAPVTHQMPPPQTPAIEIPLAVKKHLGLDSEKSWVILDEINQFAWPGFDLRPVPGSKTRYHHGLLPPKLFAQIVTGIRDVWRRDKGKSVPRD